MATGSMPAIKAKVVMMMGRKRLRPAAMRASSRSMPLASEARAASSNKMAFLATKPMSMITPMRLMRFNVPPVKSKANTTPMSDKGKENMTAKGAVNEPNCMTKMKYIKPIPEIKAMPISANTSF